MNKKYTITNGNRTVTIGGVSKLEGLSVSRDSVVYVGESYNPLHLMFKIKEAHVAIFPEFTEAQIQISHKKEGDITKTKSQIESLLKIKLEEFV